MSNDIDLLYAAKNFVNYLELEEPPKPENFPSLEKVNKSMEAKYKEFSSTLDCSKLDEQETEEESLEFENKITDVYNEFRAEAEKVYRELGDKGSEEARALKKILDDFSRDYFYLGLQGYVCSQLNDEEGSSSTNQAIREFVEKEDRKFRDEYLGSAGIDSEAGECAWTVARYAGMSLGRILRKTVRQEQLNAFNIKKVNDEEVKVDESNLKSVLELLVEHGLQTANGSVAPVKNYDDFKRKAADWLYDEVTQKLATEKEFNLLEYASLRKENGEVYIRLDIREND